MMVSLTPYRRNKNVYDPFRDMEMLEKQLFGEPFGTMASGMSSFATDISDRGDSYFVEADLPGFNKEDISLNLNGDTLSIEAERHLEHENKDKQGSFLVCERASGKYIRSFDVSNVDTDAISAAYENGVLKLTLPKKQPAQPAVRKLEIR